MMRETVLESVRDFAEKRPEQIAVIDHGRETTYLELYSMICGYQGYLREQGVGKGRTVVCRADQTLEHVVVYFSIHAAGGVAAPLEKRTPPDRVLRAAVQLQADFILTDESRSGLELREAAEQRRGAAVLPAGDVLKTAREYAGNAEPISFPSLEDPADILFTTGTTGESKGVELSQKALTAAAENLIFGCRYQPDTVILVPSPINHANAIRKLLASMVNGSTIYLLDGMMNLRAFYNALEYQRGSIACCLPPAAIRTLFQLTQDKLGAYADRIDFIESASSPLPESDKLRLCRLLPNTRLYNNYGSSESASACMYDYNAVPGKVGCIGKPMPNSEILIVGDDRRPILSSAENPGLIACRSDANMTRYVNAPELTRKVLADGIVYTSDLGYQDEEGYLYLVGRKGDVINVGGLKVSPSEVEETAMEYDGVEECVCLGVEEKTTVLKLLLVMQNGSTWDPRGIKAFLSERLEAYKVPRYYEAVDQIQKTYNGKIDRKAYRTRADGKAEQDTEAGPVRSRH